MMRKELSKWIQLWGRLSSRYLSIFVAVTIALVTGKGIASAVEVEWPIEIETPDAKIVMYQLQPDSLKGDKLTGRAAVSVTPKGSAEPEFGAVWIAARVLTDRDTRMVTILDVDIPEIKFPHVAADQEKQLAQTLDIQLTRMHITMSLDRLLTSLELAEKEKAAAEGFQNNPPKIIFTTVPSVLITIEGEPKLRPVEKSDLMRVANTPFIILFDSKTKAYYLKGGDTWLSARDVMGPWQTEPNPPGSVLAIAKRGEAGTAPQPAGELEMTKAKMPRIIVVTEPAELIATDGEPTYTPIEGTDLLYVSNTLSNVFLDIDSQEYYVVLSGRWYRSGSLAKGDWAYVPSDKLPAGFAMIPPGSPKGDVLSFVAGTEQAREAVLDESIPQTTAIKRKGTTIEVVYDGPPKFERIPGTGIDYAVNTSYEVLKIRSMYYAVYQGVWYVSDSPEGPWEVSDSRPEEVDAIPPSSPVYNVKYVYVYDSTPDVVYVGYTPGYLWSFVYGGTVVYGTGFYYPGWYGPAYYFPGPVTWGFNALYDPWYGWNFGVGLTYGWFNFGIAWGGPWVSFWGSPWCGWWGPRGFVNHHTIIVNRNVTVNKNVISNNKVRVGGRHAGISRGDLTRNNIYNRRENRQWSAHSVPERMKTSQRQAITSEKKGPGTEKRVRAAQGRRNNVFTDREGNIYRRTEEGWQRRDRSGWTQSTRPQRSGEAPRSTARPTYQQPFGGNRDELVRQQWARERGAQRAREFQRFSGPQNLGGSGGPSMNRGGSQRGGNIRGGGGSR
ncbi:MAG: carbohydrate-binding family V/XII [bacterium]